MKKKQNFKPLSEMKSGKLDGGFAIISVKDAFVGGVAEPVNNCKVSCPTNNCHGGNCGNCVLGCGDK